MLSEHLGGWRCRLGGVALQTNYHQRGWRCRLRGVALQTKGGWHCRLGGWRCRQKTSSLTNIKGGDIK